MKTSIRVILGIFAVVVLLDLATTTERHSEINWATGATRSRTTRALVFRGEWKARPTWVSERATELGLKSDHEWRHLSRRTAAHFIVVIRACGETPASYPLNIIAPDDLSREQQDAFVVRFVQGCETERENLIRQLVNGDFAIA